MSRFVIGANPLTNPEKEEIRSWLWETCDCSWWSWIDGFWLVEDSRNALTAAEINSRIHRVAPNARIMVLELAPGGTWAGHGPGSQTNPKHNMFHWFKNVRW